MLTICVSASALGAEDREQQPCLRSFDDLVDSIECPGAFDEHQQVVLIAIRAL